ncbi:MAG TPA: glycosyltransferase family 39 protein [Thermoguttaceae bacterium]|nr:glycosyltransferase family 39 protein [Thermoguttaceae bacterium]
MADAPPPQTLQNTQTFQIAQNTPPSQSAKNPPGNVQTAWFLVGLLLLAGGVRSAALDRPLLGNFATKNVALAMIARNWAEGRSPWYYPRVDVLVEGQRGLHLLELPVGAYLAGVLWQTLGGSLDLWGRVCSVAFYTAAAAVFFLWAQTRWGPQAARAAALMLVLSPVGIIYGQSFMLDASLVFFTVVGLACLDQYLCRGGWIWWGLTAANLSLLMVTKPYLAVWLIPAGWMISTSPANRRRKIGAWLALGAAVAPAAAWYLHVMQTTGPQNPLARHVFDSLRKSMIVYRPPDPLLASAQFYRQVLDDLAGPVLTPIGFSLMLLGLMQGGFRRYGIWLLPPLILLLAMPRKFFEMNYYWTAVLPAWCVLAGLGWQRVAEGTSMGRLAKAVCWLAVGVFAFRYAVKPAFVTPAEDRPVLEAASAVQELAEPEEPVITMHGSTIDLLYYCRRPGWAFRPDDPQLADRLRQCQTVGARWAVVVGRDGLAEQLGPHRPPVHQEGTAYRIYRLLDWQ